MSLYVVFWVASLAGAALFFGAGMLASRGARRPAARDGAVMSARLIEPLTRAEAGPPPEVAVLRDEVAAFRTVAAVAHGEADVHRKAREAVKAQLDAAEAEVVKLRQEVALQRTEADRAGKAEARARAESDKARTEADRARADTEKARAALEQAQGRVAALEGDEARAAAKVAALEAQLEERRREVLGLRQSVDDAEAMLAASPSPAMEQTLRQDLAVKAQLLAATEQRLARTAEENARLQQGIEELARLQRELERMSAENNQLRAQGFANAGPAPRPTRSVRLDSASHRGDVLQSLVEQVSSLADIRCAVIADELGLVVASHGELGEEVAAVGALFGRAGLQAQQVLPLRNVQRVIVEDDQNVVLTLRPLGSGGADDAELALITLAVGPGPDPHQVTSILQPGPPPALSS
jgi:hypothetical protein